MKLIKNISFFIVVSTFITFIANYLESDFLFKYLQDNLIGLLLMLLAINTATLGLIASKIQDIFIKFPKMNFLPTIKEMKKSLLEQIILIVLSILCLIINSSSKLNFNSKENICNIILVAILIYAINILWDTGKAVFIIIDQFNKINGQK